MNNTKDFYYNEACFKMVDRSASKVESFNTSINFEIEKIELELKDCSIKWSPVLSHRKWQLIKMKKCNHEVARYDEILLSSSNRGYEQCIHCRFRRDL